MADEKVLVTNRAALHEFHILDRFEAGIALQGTEVKSIRAGQIQLKESYVAVRDGEAWLFNAHISQYSHGNRLNHDPTRTRKLLLHRREIDKLDDAATTKGMTLVGTRAEYGRAQVSQFAGLAARTLRTRNAKSVALAPRPEGLGASLAARTTV